MASYCLQLLSPTLIFATACRTRHPDAGSP